MPGIVTASTAPQRRARVSASHHAPSAAPRRDRALRLTVAASTGAKVAMPGGADPTSGVVGVALEAAADGASASTSSKLIRRCCIKSVL